MKKWMTGIILVLGTFGLALGASAAETDNGDGTKLVDGAGTTSIPVNGTLGADNKKPDAGIDEGNTDWVNVTVPSKTLFYSVAGSTTVQSPNYTVTNNSGRPVTVTADSFATTAAGSLSDVSSLNVSLNATVGTGSTATATVPVITSGAANIATATSLGELANSEGRLTSAGTTTNPTSLKFNYSGSFSSGDVTGQITESYNLGLTFTPTKW